MSSNSIPRRLRADYDPLVVSTNKVRGATARAGIRVGELSAAVRDLTRIISARALLDHGDGGDGDHALAILREGVVYGCTDIGMDDVLAVQADLDLPRTPINNDPPPSSLSAEGREARTIKEDELNDYPTTPA